MKKLNTKSVLGAVALAAVFTGCGEEANDDPQVLATSNALQVYADAADNPIPTGATVKATAWNVAGNLKLEMELAGFPPNRAFGAHLHKLACQDNKAGGHYQHMAAPTMDGVNTPTYANPMNEAWLDFTTSAEGGSKVETMQDWLPRAGEAMSVVIHAMTTDENGRAGDKLACVPLSLP